MREANAKPSVYVADNGIYSEPNMQQLNAAGGEMVESGVGNLHRGENTASKTTDDGSIKWYSQVMNLSQGSER
ncbi:MAG: hypothetical protein NVS9B9_28040 [Ktedonobacteraceae bacterium]